MPAGNRNHQFPPLPCRLEAECQEYAGECLIQSADPAKFPPLSRAAWNPSVLLAAAFPLESDRPANSKEGVSSQQNCQPKGASMNGSQPAVKRRFHFRQSASIHGCDASKDVFGSIREFAPWGAHKVWRWRYPWMERGDRPLRRLLLADRRR